MSALSVIQCTSAEVSDLKAEPGQVVLVKDHQDDPGKVFMWNGESFVPLTGDMNSEITLTAYDMNKQIIHQLPALSAEELEQKKELIYDFCKMTDNEYYMLLCRDINYFTLCHRVQSLNELITIQDLIIECAQVHGEIKSIEQVDGAIEIWVDLPNFEDSTYAMYFFPYDGGVEVCQ